MYENGKIRHVGTIPGVGGRELKENGGGSEFNYHILKNFSKCHNIPLVQQ
jgi:hypothetical protein